MSGEDRPNIVQSEEQRQKLLVEARKIEVDIQLAQAKALFEEKKAEAEIRKLDVETAKLELEREATAQNVSAGLINLNQMQRQEEAALAADIFHKFYHFTDDVTEKSIKACMDRLAYWRRTTKDLCDITIVFSSPGGSLFDGLVLFDYIQEMKTEGHHITTGALGMAASMAGILLQAGTTRYMGKEAWMLIHEISSIAWGKSSAIEDEAAFLKRIQSRIVDIFMHGVEQAKTNRTATSPLTRKKIEEGWKRKDWWVDADQALKYGLIDTIR